MLSGFAAPVTTATFTYSIIHCVKRGDPMRQFNEDNLTDEVVARLKKTKNPRLREIMQSAVKHLHAFAREVKLTEEEWFEGIKFLTAVGQKCDGKRQEFILLSDVLGLSMMVVALNHKTAPGATEATVLGRSEERRVGKECRSRWS